MEILRVLNIVPSQLFPNTLGYIRAFERVCEDLDVTPTMGVLFSFYTTKLVRFEVMDFRKVIRLWMGGGKHIASYLDQMSKISTEERTQR
ncbi:hypothetical protein KIW84_052347 [Lathyrus oleraceus]|uniref:Uncharacterized protein n=1 Tax=Pisum sativum TaxID=3888 RepID=A0A9D4WNF4_PEA|nr:hypothetical protein KIW84_052347 [Pisum sativum]